MKCTTLAWPTKKQWRFAIYKKMFKCFFAVRDRKFVQKAIKNNRNKYYYNIFSNRSIRMIIAWGVLQ